MRKSILLKKMLVIGTIVFLLGTCGVNAENKVLIQKKETSYVENGIYAPYLEIVLKNETKIFNVTDDTYIANYNSYEINGGLDYLATRNRYGNGDIWECDILVKFDYSSIPQSTPIQSASLNLYYFSWGDTNPAGRPLTVYQITSDWDEMTVNFITQPTKAINVSASQVIPNTIGTWMHWDVTNDVQQSINEPGKSYGWEIMDESYWGTYWVPVAYFYPKEYVYLPPVDPFIPYLEVVLSDGTKTFTPTDDTYIANYDPSEINGGLDYLATRNRYGGGSNIWECDILIKFDISSIPQSTPILSASLNLYYDSWGDSNPKGRPLTVYRITSDWDEDMVNYDRRPTKASTISASENIPSSVGVKMSWDVTTDVQQFVNNADINYGWEIMDETYWGTYWVPAAYFLPKEAFPSVSIPAFLFGRIADKAMEGDSIIFEAVNIKLIYLNPIAFYTFSSNEMVMIEKEHIGVVVGGFIFALCKVSPIY